MAKNSVASGSSLASSRKARSRAAVALATCLLPVALLASQAGAKRKTLPPPPPPPSVTSTYLSAPLQVGGYALATADCKPWGPSAVTTNGQVYSVSAFGWTESAATLVSLSKDGSVFYTQRACVQGVVPA